MAESRAVEQNDRRGIMSSSLFLQPTLASWIRVLWSQPRVRDHREGQRVMWAP